jgi:hypothetical protein
MISFFFSPEIMSSDGSPPRVRQRIEESVADRLHRMQSRQVLSKRNLLHPDLRDPRSASYCSNAPGEQLGVPLQLCLPCLSQTGAEILWPYDRHSR